MNEPKAPKGTSGEHPIVVAFRKKLDSIQDHTLGELEELVERVEKLNEKSERPPPPAPETPPDSAEDTLKP